jgi:predicted PurR-regulated permease PerM
MWFLGIELALVLTILASVLELIPNFGPILASIPALLVAFSQDGRTVIWVASLFLIVQLLESYIVLPLIHRKTVATPPALLIVAVVLLGMLAGVLGALVASPLLAVAIVIVKELYVEELNQATVEVASGSGVPVPSANRL